MKYVIYFFALIILLGINLGLFNNLQIHGQIPNLLFLASLFFVLEKKDHDFFFISFTSGLLLDFFSSGFFGSFTLAFLIITLGLHFFINNLVVVELNWKTLITVSIICLFILNSLIWLFGLIAYKFGFISNYTSFRLILSAFPASLIYNWLLLYPMYQIITNLVTFVENLTIRRRGIIR